MGGYLIILIIGVIVLPLFLDVNISGTFDLAKALILYTLGISIIIFTLIRSLTKRRIFIYLPLSILVFFFLLTSTVATLTSRSLIVSFFGNYSRYEGLLTLASYLLLFYAMAQLSWRYQKIVLKLAVLSATISAIYGIMQHFHYDPLSLSWGEFSRYRVVATFGNPVFAAAYFAMALPLAWALTLNSHSYTSLTLWASSSLILLVGLLYTNTRGSILGFFIGIIVFVIISAKLCFERRGKKLLSLILPAFLSIVYFNLKPQSSFIARFLPKIEIAAQNTPSTSTKLKKIIKENQKDTKERRIVLDSSASVRVLMWKIGKAIIQDNSLYGIGLDTLAYVYPYYLARFYSPEYPFEYEDKIHNETFDIGLTRGLLGSFSYWWLILGIILFGFYRWKKVKERLKKTSQMKEELSCWLILWVGSFGGFLAYLIQAQTSFSVIPTGALFWILSGKLVSSFSEDKRANLSDQGLKGLISFCIHPVIGISAALILALLGGFFYYLLYKADRYYFLAQRANERGDWNECVNMLKKSIKTNPWEYFYKEELLRIYVDRLRSDLSLAPLIEKESFAALKLFKNWGQFYAITGMAKEAQGNLNEAVFFYKKALELNPYLTSIYNNLGVSLIRLGRLKEATQVLLKGYRLASSGDLRHNLELLSHILKKEGYTKELKEINNCLQ